MVAQAKMRSLFPYSDSCAIPSSPSQPEWKTLGKTLTLGRIEAKRRRGQQDEMDGWHHQFNGHEFE